MDFNPYKQQMNNSVQHLTNELKSLQIGRASSWLVENINVEATYGIMKLSQIWHITVMDAQTIKIEPRDKNEIKHIEKAIYEANTWLTPQNEWSYIIIKVPALTQERRTEITKQVKAIWEETKARIRTARQDAMKDTKKTLDAKEIWEDEHKRNEKEIDIMVKSMNEQIDELVKNKSEEVMKV